jgi:glycosyltransferase involved in cell wall biosynthesis
METLLVVVLAAATIVAILFQGVPLVLAAQMPRLDSWPNPTGGAPQPLVSVIIAARNEELDLGPALDGLLAQSYSPLEVIVVDGGSTDGTREVARARGDRVRVIEEPPLPPGGVGKNWACDVGYRASHGEYLLFTDADMRYHREVVRTTVAWAEAERADLATLAPALETHSFWEKVVLPFYVQMVLTYFRTPRVNHDGSRAAMANGQFTLVRRAPYEELGGHAAIRGYVLEDVALARRYRSAGKRLRVAWAPELLTTRMYRDRTELFEGLRKNVHDTRFSALRQLVFLGGILGLFLLPLLVLPVGWWLGSVVLELLGAFVWVAWFAKHALFARAIGMSAAHGLLFPVAAAFYLVLVGSSLVAGLRGRPVKWKGRSYAMNGEPSAAGPSSDR